MQISTATVGNSTEVPQTVTNHPVVEQFHFWVISNWNEVTFLRRHLYTHAHCSTVYSRQDVKMKLGNENVVQTRSVQKVCSAIYYAKQRHLLKIQGTRSIVHRTVTPQSPSQ